MRGLPYGLLVDGDVVVVVGLVVLVPVGDSVPSGVQYGFPFASYATT